MRVRVRAIGDPGVARASLRGVWVKYIGQVLSLGTATATATASVTASGASASASARLSNLQLSISTC